MTHRSVVAIGLLSALFFPSSGWALSQVAPVGATVTVDGRHPWIDSGLLVRKGEALAFQAAGTIQWGTRPDQVAGPDGHGSKAGRVGPGGLIGRIGINGRPFAIGATHAPVVMSKGGRLYLGINDFVFGDNAGAFVVAIVRQAP